MLCKRDIEACLPQGWSYQDARFGKCCVTTLSPTSIGSCPEAIVVIESPLGSNELQFHLKGIETRSFTRSGFQVTVVGVFPTTGPITAAKFHDVCEHFLHLPVVSIDHARSVDIVHPRANTQSAFYPNTATVSLTSSRTNWLGLDWIRAGLHELAEWMVPVESMRFTSVTRFTKFLVEYFERQGAMVCILGHTGVVAMLKVDSTYVGAMPPRLGTDHSVLIRSSESNVFGLWRVNLPPLSLWRLCNKPTPVLSWSSYWLFPPRQIKSALFTSESIELRHDGGSIVVFELHDSRDIAEFAEWMQCEVDSLGRSHKVSFVIHVTDLTKTRCRFELNVECQLLVFEVLQVRMGHLVVCFHRGLRESSCQIVLRS